MDRPRPQKRHAEAIWSAALRAVDPARLVSRNVRRVGDRLVVGGRSFPLSSFQRIYAAAIGKAAPAMAGGLASILGERLTEGLVLCSSEMPRLHPNIRCLPAVHPVPDKRSIEAAKALLALARKAQKDDLFLVLLSGGGSAQACLPAAGLSLGDKRLITGRLLRAGADIFELNTVRKHLSAFKGGRLAQAAYPASVLNLVLSDVRRNDLQTIASGPTYWDSTTFARARAVLRKYGLWTSAPQGVRRVIEAGLKKAAPETLKKRSPVFRQVESFILGDVRTALEAGETCAKKLGFEARILTTSDQGEAREAAVLYANLIRAMVSGGNRTGRPLCLLAGGELTVTVRGRGRGGRNSEFVLASLIERARTPLGTGPKTAGRDPFWLVASLGTDGIDGPTDAAGAWASPAVAARARRLGLDPRSYLDRNDAYSFFAETGSLIKTGPTGTNVMDLRLFLLDFGR